MPAVMIHAAFGSATQRGMPLIRRQMPLRNWILTAFWMMAALASHGVMDRLIPDHTERAWEYVVNVVLLVLLALYARRYWLGALIAAAPDIEHPLHLLFGTPRPYHDLVWSTPWHTEYWATVAITYGLTSLVLLAMAWQPEAAQVIRRCVKHCE